ncbi:hypothetical protein [Actinoalloteichus sp. AHMU CJ021]|uniref:hypothetical protein n=1 Tax=Actinoalloteichus sp. AHMU CJ021 TaxID=2072503 RepID=UPI00307B331E
MAIDEKQGSKSEQLAKRLSSQQGKIITVTLQTFPALLDYLRRNPTEIQGARFAIVVDEAHSSQSGDAAGDVRKVLRGLALDADDDSGEAGASEARIDKDDIEAKSRPSSDSASPNARRTRTCRTSRSPPLRRPRPLSTSESSESTRASPPSCRSTPTRCGRPSRRASSSTRCATTSPTTPTGS